MKLYDLSVCGVQNTLVAPTEKLRFSWKLESENDNTFQVSSRFVITKKNIGVDAIVYDSLDREGCESVLVEPAGLRLDPLSDYIFALTVTDNHGETASASLNFSTGLSDNDWAGAKWIRPKEHISGWAPYLRTKFIVGGKDIAGRDSVVGGKDVAGRDSVVGGSIIDGGAAAGKKIARARLYACGLGCAEYYINGRRTDDYFVDPPATNYEKTVLYRGTDVTDLIKEGGNALTAFLGEGFYSQSRVWGSNGFVFGKECLIALLKIDFEDGTSQLVKTDTDGSWSYKYGPISTNNIYAGEVYDCRLETPDFADFNSDDAGWGEVIEDETPKGTLTDCLMPPVRIIREIPCKSVKCASGASDGAWIFDLGENFAGTYEVRIPANSPRGAVYVFRTSEALNKGGGLDHRSTGAFATQCIQQDIYIARGGSETEIFRPRFTYHGFRYVEITGIHDFSKGYGTMPEKDMIKGLALSTDFRQTGWFDSDNIDLNKLHALMQNTFRSNYHGYPEDCPAREKCGWLGDAEVVVNWGLFNYDTLASYEKYLSDIRTSTEVYGTWQMIAPGKRGCGEATPLWGCAQIIIPYYMWQYLGDSAAVTDNIDLMRRWVQHETNRAPDCIISEGLGDWCPPVGHESPLRMPVSHSSTLMYYEICTKMAEISRAFGYGDEAHYDELAEKIRESFNRHFYDYEKHTYGYWGSNGAAILTGIFPDGEKKALTDETVRLIRDEKYAMTTGIYGNKYLVPALMKDGYGEDALRFLFNRFATSFGTMMDDGATSIWESTDMHFVEMREDIGVSSYNHPMHGGFMYSYYTCIAGIEPLAPGFRRFRVKPCHMRGIKRAAARFDSPYGEIEVVYNKRDDGPGFRYTVKVPANTQAVFEAPGAAEPMILGSGTWVI